MAKKYKVIYDRPNCIGAANCVAADPDHWSLAKDGKADLKGAKKKDSSFELEIDEKHLEKMKKAAKSCPVNVIHIIDAETSRRII